MKFNYMYAPGGGVSFALLLSIASSLTSPADAGSRHPERCPFRNGYYCGNSRGVPAWLHLDPDTVYYCHEGVYTPNRDCARHGLVCHENEPYNDDVCKRGPHPYPPPHPGPPPAPEVGCCDNAKAATACGTSKLAQLWEDVTKTGCNDKHAIARVYPEYFTHDVKVIGLPFEINGLDELIAAFVDSGDIGRLCNTEILYWTPEKPAYIDAHTHTFRWDGFEEAVGGDPGGREYVFDCDGDNKVSEIVVN
mmetsp:Transcript_6914/g.14525  ORF Transcript_6914/g.14525 Transcript_6914/m.14525 type:complete len:249 (-) Transcript_6914:107-853(-)